MSIEYALWRLAIRTGLDPEVVRAKRRSVIDRWQLFSAADAMYDDWMTEQAEANMKRQLGG